MALEVKTLRFSASPAGQEQKSQALAEHLSQGWVLVSETISAGNYNVDAAVTDSICTCLVCGPLCAPFGLLGKQSSGSILVTLTRSEEAKNKADSEAEDARLILRQRLMEDTKRASLSTLLDEFRQRFPDTYLSHNLLKAVDDYISNYREAGGAVPSLEKSDWESGSLVLRDGLGTRLKSYSRLDLSRLPEPGKDV